MSSLIRNCFLSIVSCIFVITIAFSQEPCEHQPSDKVLKLLEKSKDRKNDSNDRTEAIEKALEIDPECLPCLHQKGEMEFLRAKTGSLDFTASKETFKNLIDLCPTYHPEPFYYLGAMCYADREYDIALTYFDQFLRFESDDPKIMDKQYEKKYKDVEEALPTVKAD